MAAPTFPNHDPLKVQLTAADFSQPAPRHRAQCAAVQSSENQLQEEEEEEEEEGWRGCVMWWRGSWEENMAGTRVIGL